MVRRLRLVDLDGLQRSLDGLVLRQVVLVPAHAAAPALALAARERRASARHVPVLSCVTCWTGCRVGQTAQPSATECQMTDLNAADDRWQTGRAADLRIGYDSGATTRIVRSEANQPLLCLQLATRDEGCPGKCACERSEA